MTKPIPRPKRGKPIQLDGPMAALAFHFNSVNDLAEAIGVDPGTISRWDRGAINPRTSTRKLLAFMARARGLEPPFPVE